MAPSIKDRSQVVFHASRVDDDCGVSAFGASAAKVTADTSWECDADGAYKLTTREEVYGALTGIDETDTRTIYTASRLGGAYIFALNITGIPDINGLRSKGGNEYQKIHDTHV